MFHVIGVVINIILYDIIVSVSLIGIMIICIIIIGIMIISIIITVSLIGIIICYYYFNEQNFVNIIISLPYIILYDIIIILLFMNIILSSPNTPDKFDSP